MSTTTFRPSACPSYWTFVPVSPLPPHRYRMHGTKLGSALKNTRALGSHAVMLTVHRSIKAIYGSVILAHSVSDLRLIITLKNSSELSRALNDGLDHQIRECSGSQDVSRR
ncbi:hypothetical protein Pst134EA_019397 [Puccinia striiformis f. sp. tritici]|uniref:hypothetical protein n=1 Tax=Puccinia striiformis f. sp. tritici TaxID=168172 RepID=UPI0020081772|nr:hypothetical protein Pst134EA_019397 [Puccinia striiformis f. sp. tritici]KAH9459245.1 hypothetical protein Pst134EA_019397 [Puccinia striiformis f. sp. tritici]